MKRYLSIFLLLVGGVVQAQDKVKLDFSGFVNTQLFYDTRQVEGGREALLELYPQKIRLDSLGNDLNASPNLNGLGMVSRFTVSLSGTTFLNGDLTALLEGDFSGQTNNDNNGFRLRHAWIKNKWSNASILVGQFWHPLNFIELVPEVVGLSTGAPYRPFSRHPQIRAEYFPSNLKLIGVLSFQRDYASSGPMGVTSRYLMQSAIPNLDLQLQYQKNSFFVAADGGVKVLRPRLKTDLNYATDEKITSYYASAIGMVTFNNLVFKAQGVWGQNLSEHIMLGGYIEREVLNSSIGEMEYANASQASAWLDLATTYPTWNVGLFCGYAKNLGFESSIRSASGGNGKFYGRGDDIASTFRVSPRLLYQYKPLKAALETELTQVAYGVPDEMGKINSKDNVFNFRVLLSLTYFF